MMKIMSGIKRDKLWVIWRLSFLFAKLRSKKKRSFAPPLDKLRSKMSTKAFFLQQQN
jgi:hypothetical protein